MSESKNEPAPADPRPRGQVLLPAVAIGSLSVALAAGLSFLGILDRLNSQLADWLAQGKILPKALPVWWVWLAAAFFAYGIALVILSVPGTWRRGVLWITTLIVTMGWAPVLALSARQPSIGAVWVAVGWAGVCALVYAGRHRMACEDFSTIPSDETR